MELQFLLHSNKESRALGINGLHNSQDGEYKVKYEVEVHYQLENGKKKSKRTEYFAFNPFCRGKEIYTSDCWEAEVCFPTLMDTVAT